MPLLYVYDCYPQFLKRTPSALTIGLCIFSVIFYLLCSVFPSLSESLVLNSAALTKLQLNRLSFYPLVHLNWLHLLVNLVSLAPLLSAFESVHGTVRTGVVLNVLAVVTGVAYSIIGILLFPTMSVAGSSAWVFSFLAYYAYQDYRRIPTWHVGRNMNLPTWSTPLLSLAVATILFPGSSFFGHVLGLCAGYAMALGYLDKLIEPSTNVIEWIETKLTRQISLIPSIVKFYRETLARDSRVAFKESAELPIAESDGTAFPGAGHSLA